MPNEPAAASALRMYCTVTPEDYKAVHKLQDQEKAIPLSTVGR
jgi:hypothetical protein